MASAEYDATADFADEAMAQRVMEEEKLSRKERKSKISLRVAAIEKSIKAKTEQHLNNKGHKGR